ncbi:hypothetical protein D3C71_182230 [compost metagenome]
MISLGKTRFSPSLFRRSPHEPKRRAARWLVHLTSGEATPGDLAAFRRWRDRRPENRAALCAVRDTWVILDGAAVRTDVTPSGRPSL